MIIGKKIAGTAVSCKVISSNRNRNQTQNQEETLQSEPQLNKITQTQIQSDLPVGLQYDVNMFDQPINSGLRHEWFPFQDHQTEEEFYRNARKPNFYDEFAQNDQREIEENPALSHNQRRVTQFFVSNSANPAKVHKQQVAKNDRLSAIFQTHHQTASDREAVDQADLVENDRRTLNSSKIITSSKKDVCHKKQPKNSHNLQTKNGEQMEEVSYEVPDQQSTFDKAKKLAAERVRMKRAQESKKAEAQSKKTLKYKAPLPTKTVKPSKPLYKSVKQEIHQKLIERQKRRQFEEAEKNQIKERFHKNRQETTRSQQNHRQRDSQNQHQSQGISQSQSQKQNQEFDIEDQSEQEYQERAEIPHPIQQEPLGVDICGDKQANADGESQKTESNGLRQQRENEEVSFQEQRFESQQKSTQQNQAEYCEQVSKNEFLPSENEQESAPSSQQMLKIAEIDFQVGLHNQEVDDAAFLKSLSSSNQIYCPPETTEKFADHSSGTKEQREEFTVDCSTYLKNCLKNRLIRYHESSSGSEDDSTSQSQLNLKGDEHTDSQLQNTASCQQQTQIFEQMTETAEESYQSQKIIETKKSEKKAEGDKVSTSKNCRIQHSNQNAGSSEEEDEDQNPVLQQYLKRNNLLFPRPQPDHRDQPLIVQEQSIHLKTLKIMGDYAKGSIIEEREEQYVEGSRISFMVNSQVSALIQDSSSEDSDSDDEREDQNFRHSVTNRELDATDGNCSDQKGTRQAIMGNIPEELFQLGVNDLLNREYLSIN